MTRHQKAKVDARALIARLNAESKHLLQREIIAPLLPHGKIRTRIGKMIYEFRPQGEFMGWGRFRPLNEWEAEWLCEAQPWERGNYLELFPVLRMILLWPDPRPERPGTWLALPYNDSDAQQRFGLSMEPHPVLLCDPAYGADRFERILARVDGKTLWFDGLDVLADPTHSQWLRDTLTEEPDKLLSGLAGSERLARRLWQIRQIEIALEPVRRQQAVAERRRRSIERQRNRQQQRAQRRQESEHQLERSLLEARLHYALAKADAVLHNYSEHLNPDGSIGTIVVEWSERGQRHRYRSTVDDSLTVVSSGICLSDMDSDFDLTSLVNVVTDSDHY